MQEVEERIRARLGIPPSARYVLIVDQSAHLDWDWTSTFGEYFKSSADAFKGVNGILSQALQLLNQNVMRHKAPHYYYSTCEMGYLQRFVSHQLERGSDVVPYLRALHPFLRIVGGGITSPDCLLSSGEAFLRNYLAGKLWLASVLPELLPIRHCWLPDDFGQDPELPVAAAALGVASICFSRIPGTAPGQASQANMVENELLQDGIDFMWQSSDSASAVFTHWLTGQVPGYYQGGALKGCENPTGPLQPCIVSAIQSFLRHYNLNQSYNPPFSGAKTPYLYIPLDDDFMVPIPDLLEYVDLWNASTPTPQVYAVEASYDDFVSLVRAAGDFLRPLAYNGTPYWTGYYMSRPELKILHYGAIRRLISAEVFGLLATPGLFLPPCYWGRVAQAWSDLLPSTHHDYVTGTASDFVYQFEQLPLLATAHREALGAANDALAALTASVGPLEATNLVVIANPAGVSFIGAVDLPGPLPPGMKGIQFGNATNAVQPTNAGGLLFLATIDSLGYTTGTLTTQPGSLSNPAGISTPDLGNSYILKNQYLTVTVGKQSSWGISAISDCFGNSLLNSSGVGNQLVFYNDGGDIYAFGNEYPGFNFAVDPVTFETSDATMLEQGPVRVRLKTVVSVTIGSTPWTYVREYCLVAGEPFLRMTTTGAAPQGYSIMTSFDLAQPVQSIVRGTPCHWTAVQPLAMWPAPVFQASHHFLIPEGEAGPLAVIYHPEVPGWSYDGHGVLLGCLLRNTPAQHRGAFGSDSASHTLRYALRTPSGLGDPTTGQPLMEALTYVMPPSAAFRPVYPSYNANTTPPNPPSPLLPQSGSLASVDPPGVILAAKPGDVEPGTLVLRIYQPTNSPQTLTVTLGKRPREVIAVTALEDPIVTDAPAIRVTESGFTIDVKTALNTVQIRK